MNEMKLALNFVWPAAGVHPDHKKNVEEALRVFMERILPFSTFCHSGPLEVHIAQSMPMNQPVNAVVTCNCGFPTIALAGTVDSSDKWKVTRL
jgi:hypothetical protein